MKKTETQTENQKIVTLSQPIKRGENSFTDITVFKPNVPALKGLKLIDVFSLETDALCLLLPKITQPMLHKADFDTMDIADFAELATAAIGFLGKNSEPTETDEVTETEQVETK